MGRQHQHIVKRVLFNGAGGTLEPTRENIENVFDTLLEAKDNDTVAVFIAGHGYNDPRSGYQFLPTNVRRGRGQLGVVLDHQLGDAGDRRSRPPRAAGCCSSTPAVRAAPTTRA